MRRESKQPYVLFGARLRAPMQDVVESIVLVLIGCAAIWIAVPRGPAPLKIELAGHVQCSVDGAHLKDLGDDRVQILAGATLDCDGPIARTPQTLAAIRQPARYAVPQSEGRTRD